MSEETSFSKEKENSQRHVTDAFRKILLIGIGTAMLAQEEGEAFVKKLRDKGEKAEAKGRKRLREVHDRRRHKTEEGLEKRIDQVLQHMDIPTRADYLDLSEKISELSKKLDGD